MSKLKKTTQEEDELPPLVDTDGEDEEDLPPLVDTDDEEGEEDLPPLVDTDDEEEDLPPLVDTDEEEGEEDLPPLVDTDDEDEDLPPLVDTDEEEEEKKPNSTIKNSIPATLVKIDSDDELPPLMDTDDEKEHDELPPLLDTDDEEGEDLPVLIDADDEEEGEEDLPPLVDTDEDEEDLPPLVDTDEEQQEIKRTSAKDEQNSIDLKNYSNTIPTEQYSEPYSSDEGDEPPPLIESTESEDETMQQLSHSSDDDMPPLIEESEDELPGLIEMDDDIEDDSDYHSGEDTDDDDFFQATQTRRRLEKEMNASSISETIPKQRSVPTNIEKNKKEWEEYKVKLEESKKRKESKKKREEQKRQQLLQEQQQQEATSTKKSQTPSTSNEPQIETIELANCLFCNQSGRAITNKDDYYLCTCSNKCKLNFHKECWLKYYRAERNTTDRSINCPTEACGGYGEQLSYFEKLADTPKSTTLPAPGSNKPKKKPSNKEIKESIASDNVSQKKTRTIKQNASTSIDSLPTPTITENVQNNKPIETIATQNIQEPEEIKVVLSAGKFAKAVERKKFIDKAMEETERLKNAQLYKCIDFSIKTGNDIGVVIELEKPFGKILTSTSTLKCRIENLQLGDLIQFQTASGNEYAQNIELIERLQNVPQNFPELFSQLKENLKKLKEMYGTNITFKVRQSKKKKGGVTQSTTTKSKPPSSSIPLNATISTESSLIQSTSDEIPTPTHESTVPEILQMIRKVFELGDLSEEFLSKPDWCLGEILDRKETFGRINVLTHPSSMPLANRVPVVYFHVRNFNKESILPTANDKVLFFMTNQQNSTGLSATDIHVISNDMYEFLDYSYFSTK